MGKGADCERYCCVRVQAFFGKVYKTDDSLQSNAQIVCCFGKSGLYITLSLTVGEIYGLNFIVLPRFSPTFVVVGRCHYIALKSEELSPPTPFERM